MSEDHQGRDYEDLPSKDGTDEQAAPAANRIASKRASRPAEARHPVRGWLFGLLAFLPLVAGLAYGASRYSARNQAVLATAEQQRDFTPTVRVAEVQSSGGTQTVKLPATTLAFAAANIFARTSGYIELRKVDIGDHVKAGDLLAQITAPELDHQIAQAEATLAQIQATLQQTMASRDLARVTNDRDSDLVKKGWLTPQQGDTDRLTLQAQQAAVGVAESNVVAQQALIRVLKQQKDYQSVVAPFDGIVTQRNIDTGSLVQAGTTFMFTLMRSDVIRVQVNVPQDAAFGVTPGVDAVVRVPEIPDHPVHGKVTRIANALVPGTRTLLTEVDIPNADGVLSPGMYCTVELKIPRKTPSVIVSADALIFNSTGLHVAVAKDGVAHFQKVNVARDFGTTVEIHDGIKPGDKVILKPSVDLADGSKIQLSEPPTRISEQ